MLVKCPECGCPVSSLAEICSSCGYPLFLGNAGEERMGELPTLPRVERVVLGSLRSQPVEWVPGQIDREEGLILLVSAHVLARRPYSLSGSNCWWESDLADWAKGFSFDLFSSDERRIIASDPFVPTARQAGELFRNDLTRRAWPASAHHGEIWDVGAASPWWLSTPGDDESCVQYVRPDGRIFAPGARPEDKLGVRLALWVEPNATA